MSGAGAQGGGRGGKRILVYRAEVTSLEQLMISPFVLKLEDGLSVSQYIEKRHVLRCSAMHACMFPCFLCLDCAFQASELFGL